MEGDGEKETKGSRQENEVLVIYSLIFSLHLPVSLLCIFKHFPFVNTCLSHFVFLLVSNSHSHVPSQIIEIPDEGEKSPSPAKKEENKDRERETNSPSAEKDGGNRDEENEKEGDKEKSTELKEKTSSDVKAESTGATSSADTSKTKGEVLSTT